MQWEECIFCYRWVPRFMDFCLSSLVYNAICAFCVPVDLLLAEFLPYEQAVKWGPRTLGLPHLGRASLSLWGVRNPEPSAALASNRASGAQRCGGWETPVACPSWGGTVASHGSWREKDPVFLAALAHSGACDTELRSKEEVAGCTSIVTGLIDSLE